jgi:hypothetical protein
MSFQSLLQLYLSIFLFRRLPTPTQVTSKALKAYHAVAPQGGGILLTLPPELSIDRVLSAEAGCPLFRRNFLTYLINETHTAENFQFLLWVLNYTQLYTILAAHGAVGLSPVVTEQEEKEVRRVVMAARSASRTTSLISIMPPPTSYSNYTEFGVFTGCSSLSSYTPPTTAAGDCEHSTPTATNPQLSDEIEKCLATYIRPHSPRQLNLSDLERVHSSFKPSSKATTQKSFV